MGCSHQSLCNGHPYRPRIFFHPTKYFFWEIKKFLTLVWLKKSLKIYLHHNSMWTNFLASRLAALPWDGRLKEVGHSQWPFLPTKWKETNLKSRTRTRTLESLTKSRNIRRVWYDNPDSTNPCNPNVWVMNPSYKDIIVCTIKVLSSSWHCDLVEAAKHSLKISDVKFDLKQWLPWLNKRREKLWHMCLD